MRIVMVAPNTMVLPPPRDGGTERMVYELSEELVRKGHDVIMYARGGSRSGGTVISYPFEHFDEAQISNFVAHTLPPDIDIIHDHTFGSAVSRLNLNVPIVSTRHIPYKTDASHPIYVSHDNLMTIGKGEGTFIYNGLRPEDYQFHPTKQNYLLFMGRIVPDKGVDCAIDVAEWTNNRLIIAGPKHDVRYFNKQIAPRLKKNKKISYIGPVGGQERQDLLKNARCLLFPTQWREPFGLVLIEALACGTPVLGLNKGAVKEVLGGLPEFICSTPRAMAKKLRAGIAKYSPSELRDYVATHFHTSLMADRYIYYYCKVIEQTRANAVRQPELQGHF
jgi:glycosyltransferase involved in cell wall biosynthesis